MTTFDIPRTRLRHALVVSICSTLAAACGQRPLAAVAGTEAGTVAQPHRAIDWPVYARDANGTKYSPASEVTRENVQDLVPVWTYRTGDFARGDGTVRDETTPLFVDGVLYASTPFGGVRALDASLGTEIWRFDSELDLSAGYGDPTNRGVSTWLDTAAAAGATCRRRIFVGTLDARLIALDAVHGAPCAGFGSNGQVDLRAGVLNVGDRKAEFAVTSPPAI